MYDDYDLDYTFSNDYGQDLDEYTQDLDEDYARDGQDYETLAYRHYAWYTTHLDTHKQQGALWSHINAMYRLFLTWKSMKT